MTYGPEFNMSDEGGRQAAFADQFLRENENVGATYLYAGLRVGSTESKTYICGRWTGRRRRKCVCVEGVRS